MTAPYYQDDAVTIYHGDCRSFAIPSADLVLTDPPYGIDYTVNVGGRGGGKPGKLEDEKVIADDVPFDPRWLLDLAPKAVIFGANYFAHLLPPGGWIIWSKIQDNRWVDNRASTRSFAEVAWTNAHNYVALFNCFWAGSPLYRKGEERGSQLHPTQKPVDLMRWIIARVSAPGDLIVDPYMGSGPIARAAVDLGRRYVGYEIEERYCEIAIERMGQEVLAL